MQQETPISERRKHQRLNPLDGAVAALSSEEYNLVGIIQDISKGGLAFRYIATSDTPRSQSLLTIVLTSENFFLEQVPVVILRDALLTEDPTHTFSLMRKCSVSFGDLTDTQRTHLDFFLQHYTRDNNNTNQNGENPWPSSFFDE